MKYGKGNGIMRRIEVGDARTYSQIQTDYLDSQYTRYWTNLTQEGSLYYGL
jgi:hypothetical protein